VPFDGPSFGAIAAQHIATPHEPLADAARDVPRALAEVIEWCLQKERSTRWQSARELYDALQACEGASHSWIRRGLGRLKVAALL
jgi:hypothetical protein